LENDKLWLLVDTETTGFTPPIFVVELAAQLMMGWKPIGGSFRRLIKIDRETPPEVSRVHGYTREILERDGFAPSDVYKDFFTYANGAPICSYNLNYDYENVLLPEWHRLEIVSPLKSGFCLLRLTQRLLDPIPAGNHKLQTLRQFYRLPERGGHTALGDVETVVDLLAKVLMPISFERGLTHYDQLANFASQEWFPTKLPFGKYKGRSFWDAVKDIEIKGWLEWLSNSDNERSQRMGLWYLSQLSNSTAKTEAQKATIIASAVDATDLVRARGETRTGIVVYNYARLKQLKALVTAARERLADLEMIFDRERTAVSKTQAELFQLLKEFYKKRDFLKLIITYRKRFLDTLIMGSDLDPDDIKLNYESAKSGMESEFEEAEQRSKKPTEMSEQQRNELKDIYRKLAKIYHPDLQGADSEKAKAYTRLMAIITAAKEEGNIELLREIAEDPSQFMKKHNLGHFDVSADDEFESLRRLYDSLQSRILENIAAIDDLRSNPSYELYQLCTRRPGYIRDIAVKYRTDIDAECKDLAVEAERLSAEIEKLTGEPVI
jgi:DNA polymerase III epsilon subunit-like protein